MHVVCNAYDGTGVGAVSELSDGLTILAVIEEYLRVHADTGKVVTGWGIAEILDELGMRLDRLHDDELSLCDHLTSKRCNNLLILVRCA